MRSLVIWIIGFSNAIVCSGTFTAEQHKVKEVTVVYGIVSPITQHEPAVIRVTITNGLTEAIKLNLGFNRKNGFRFALSKLGRERIELPPLSEENLGETGLVTLDPGAVFSQSLLFDEWFKLRETGDYTIDVRLVASIETQSGLAIDAQTDGTLGLQVLPYDETVLRNKCEKILEELDRATTSRESIFSAQELSYIEDPVGIPYLSRILQSNKILGVYALDGLRRIGNDEAVRAVIAAAQGQDKITAAYAKGLLRKAEPNIVNPELREMIKTAIK